MDDLIERQAAHEAVYSANGLVGAMKNIDALPSVTPMQKTGYWISHENDGNKSRIGEIGDCIAIATDEPSVTPMQRTGHWIETADEYYKAVNEYGGGVNEDTPYFVDDIACSVCLAMFSTIDNETERFDYCPNCGAKMVEPQESEG